MLLWVTVNELCLAGQDSPALISKTFTSLQVPTSAFTLSVRAAESRDVRMCLSLCPLDSSGN